MDHGGMTGDHLGAAQQAQTEVGVPAHILATFPVHTFRCKGHVLSARNASNRSQHPWTMSMLTSRLSIRNGGGSGLGSLGTGALPSGDPSRARLLSSGDDKSIVPSCHQGQNSGIRMHHGPMKTAKSAGPLPFYPIPPMNAVDDGVGPAEGGEDDYQTIALNDIRHFNDAHGKYWPSDLQRWRSAPASRHQTAAFLPAKIFPKTVVAEMEGGAVPFAFHSDSSACPSETAMNRTRSLHWRHWQLPRQEVGLDDNDKVVINIRDQEEEEGMDNVQCPVSSCITRLSHLIE